MVDSVGGARVDLAGVIPADARAISPSLAELVETDAGIQDDFAKRAHARLGAPGSRPLDAWRELARAKGLEDAIVDDAGEGLDAAAQRVMRRNAHAIGVELGTSVTLPGSRPGADPWTVIGVGGSDRLELARRLPDGAIQRQVRRWPELVLANPSLVQRHIIPSNGFPTALRPVLPAPDAPTAVMDAFEMAREITPPAQWPYEHVVIAPGGEPVPVQSGTWRELATELRLTRLRPLPVHPDDAWSAASIVDTSGPALGRVVMAAEGSDALGGAVLVGTDDLVAGHRASRDALQLERVADFFERLGLKTWRDPSDTLVVTTGILDSIGNASAHGNSEYALVNMGPRDPRTTAAIANLMPHDIGEPLRRGDATLRKHWPKVLAHEVGHVATQQAWGIDTAVQRMAAVEAQDLAAFARLAEHNVAEEAFSDLFGAAYGRSRNLGVRDLARLHNGIGDLDQLRATIAALGFDHSGHTGTQLITRPMLQLQRAKGWDAVAEVTAGATKQLGARLGRGELDAIDVPSAARALRDAAAMRWGAEDDAVRGMVAAWQKLRVVL